MHHVKEGLIILFIILVLSLSVYGLGGGEISGSETSEGSILIITDLSTLPEDSGAVYTEETKDEEASLDVSETEEPIGVNSYSGALNGEEWGASATYSNVVFDKNGIYQATITGIAAGATYYIISSMGEQVLKYTASEKESTKRKIVIDSAGDTWITATLAEGDIIESGETKTDLPYTFTANEDKAEYSYADGALTQTEQGVFTYQGAFIESFEATDKVETALTAQGFYNVTLSPNTEYHYLYDTLNLSLQNTDEREDIHICKKTEENTFCEVHNTGNAFTLSGKNFILKQQGYPVLESYDENNRIEFNFAEQTAYLSNINSEEDTLAIFRTGDFEIIETQETTMARTVENESPMLFRSYDSDKPSPGFFLDDANALLYTDEDNEAKILPTEDVYVDTCIVAVQEKIGGEREDVPAFC